MQQHRNFAIPDTLTDVCDPDRIALVVYDMQVGVVGQLADGPQITERVGQVLEAAREAGVRVFFIRYMTLPKELMGASQLRMAMAWQRKQRVEDVVSPFLRDSPGVRDRPRAAPTRGGVGLSVVTLAIWAVATILGITLPVTETGTDPTRIPFGAIFAPVAAAVLTALAGAVATMFRGGPAGG